MSTFNAESGQESSEIGPAEKQDKTSESKSNVVTFRSHNTKRAPKYLAGEKTGYIAPSAKPSDGMVPADYVGKCKATSIVAKGNKNLRSYSTKSQKVSTPGLSCVNGKRSKRLGRSSRIGRSTTNNAQSPWAVKSRQAKA
jgi:hypothetical protein